MKDFKILTEAIILICISGVLIATIKWTGKYEQAEKFLYENDKVKYYVMNLCYLVLTISLTINIKYAISSLLQELSK